VNFNVSNIMNTGRGGLINWIILVYLTTLFKCVD